MNKFLDLPLLIIALLWLGSLSAYLLGLWVYPFGFFVLGIALLARLLSLRQGS